MFTEADMRVALVGVTPRLSGHERLLAAFRVGDDLLIPIEADRSSNRPLLHASRLFVHNGKGTNVRWDVVERRHVNADEQAELSQVVEAPLGDQMDVLRLSDPLVCGDGAGETTQNGLAYSLMLALDGSERACSAIAPASDLVDLLKLKLSVVPVTGGPDDRDTPAAVTLQLDEEPAAPVGLGNRVEAALTRSELPSHLDRAAQIGGIPVMATFGTWQRDGRLWGQMDVLLQRGVPTVIAVGPEVAAHRRGRPGPIMVAVDDSEHAHHVVNALDWLSGSSRAVVVVHIGNESNASDTGPTIARLIGERLGVAASFVRVTGTRVVDALVELSAEFDSPLIVMHTWRKANLGGPKLASVCRATIARAAMPVAVISDAA